MAHCGLTKAKKFANSQQIMAGRIARVGAMNDPDLQLNLANAVPVLLAVLV